MSAKVERCARCGRRYRGQDGWNDDLIAGLRVGRVCPDCQTDEEHLGAEVNLVLARRDEWRKLDLSDADGVMRFITALAATYPDHLKMRDAADRLAAARKDRQATDVVAVMRRVADDMESGELWEDDGHNIGASCMRCAAPAPTTVEEFTQWAMNYRAADGQPLGVVCPGCLRWSA